MDNMAYTITSNRSLDEISKLLDKTAPEHSFRILAVHDVKQTLGEKGFEIEPLMIYEICNAGFAYKALSKDINVAMFMPCKIVIRPEGNVTSMTLVRPTMISELLPESGLDQLAAEVEQQIIGILNEIK
jgi:uncharacterized protein (DUF302 family)